MAGDKRDDKEYLVMNKEEGYVRCNERMKKRLEGPKWNYLCYLCIACSECFFNTRLDIEWPRCDNCLWKCGLWDESPYCCFCCKFSKTEIKEID